MEIEAFECNNCNKFEYMADDSDLAGFPVYRCKAGVCRELEDDEEEIRKCNENKESI